jgi:2-keto-myo-inositol isomerase
MTAGRILLDTITLRGTPLEQQVEIAARTGYDGMELRGNDLTTWVAGGRSIFSLRQLLDGHGLPVPAICTEADLWVWHNEFGSTGFTAALDRFCEWSRELGAGVLVFPVMSTAGDLVSATANFARLADHLLPYGLTAGLEFIGHVPKVPDIGTAWRIIQETNRSNAGLVCDLFHFYRGGSTTADLEAVPGNGFAIVHLDDAMNLHREELVGSKHRVYPGEGILPGHDWLRTIRHSGYRGDFAVEIFNEQYWAEEPAEVALRALSCTRALLARSKEAQQS